MRVNQVTQAMVEAERIAVELTEAHFLGHFLICFNRILGWRSYYGILSLDLRLLFDSFFVFYICFFFRLFDFSFDIDLNFLVANRLLGVILGTLDLNRTLHRRVANVGVVIGGSQLLV